MSNVERFVEMMSPDSNGVSRIVTSDEFNQHGFVFGNGGGLIRDDGPIGSKYIVHKTYGPRNMISSVQFLGFRTDRFAHSIPQSIRDTFKTSRCAVLDIGGNYDKEIDHKVGYKEWYEMDKDVTPNDFQPLCSAVNVAKRTHCNNCKTTGVRYDARRLGFTMSQTCNPTMDNPCVGCYWYDPRAFNHDSSLGTELKDGRTYIFKRGRLQPTEIEL